MGLVVDGRGLDDGLQLVDDAGRSAVLYVVTRITRLPFTFGIHSLSIWPGS